jgi:glycosyltransferase involved in cell wall biosynthesis
MNRVRVLVLVNDLNRCNGISTFIMNYYKYIDKNKIQMDFVLCSNDIDSEYESIINENDGKIYIVDFDKSKSLIYNSKKIKNFIRKHASEYDIIHSNLINKGYYYLKYAKKYNIKTRIIHSHNMTLGDGNIIKRLVNKYFRYMTLKYSNCFFACSEGAGNFLFKDKEFKVINNAFDISKYEYNIKSRINTRSKLGIQNKKVLIQVGRLDYQKDPFYSLDLVEELKKSNSDIMLLFVGSGEYGEELKNKIIERKLEKNVMLLGTRNDVAKLYSASDYFLFPSRFEGLGLSAVEAQISGLTCLISNNVPKEAKICNNAYYLDKSDTKSWIDIINIESNNRGSCLKEARDHGFDIKQEAFKLAEIYKNIAEGKYEN